MSRKPSSLVPSVGGARLKGLCFLGVSSGSDDLDPDLIRLGSLGFTGCLSVVHFNSISPLKAALLHPDRSPVTVSGPLLRSGCGSPSANPYATEDTHQLTGRTMEALEDPCLETLL